MLYQINLFIILILDRNFHDFLQWDQVDFQLHHIITKIIGSILPLKVYHQYPHFQKDLQYYHLNLLLFDSFVKICFIEDLQIILFKPTKVIY